MSLMNRIYNLFGFKGNESTVEPVPIITETVSPNVNYTYDSESIQVGKHIT